MDTVTDFIDDLLIKHRVTLKMAYDCSVREKEAIQGMKEIFTLKKRDDFLLCMTALRILAGDNMDKIGGYFQKDSEMDYELDEQFFEKHKTLVLTAFVVNPAFFAMAVNAHGVIAYELQKQEQEVPALEHAAKRTLKPMKKFISFPLPSLQLDYLAASACGPELVEIMKPLKLDLDGIKGELAVDGSENRTIQFRFEFEELHQRFPFFLDLTYRTEADQKIHSVSLNERRNEYDIVSPMQYDIDFSQGIAITEIKGVKFD